MEYEISNRLSGVHGSMIRELFKLGASKDIIKLSDNFSLIPASLFS